MPSEADTELLVSNCSVGYNERTNMPLVFLVACGAGLNMVYGNSTNLGVKEF